jgi:hypothetical protein
MCLFLIPAIPAAVAAAGDAAISIAASAAAYAAQKQQADAQSKYESQMYQQTGKIASQNYQQTIAQTGVQGAEQAQVASNNAINNEVQSASQLGGAITGEAAGNTQGNTVNGLFDNYNRLEATNNANIQTQLGWQQQQAEQNLAAARSTAQGQISSATPAPVAQPSLLATGLSMTGSVAQASNQYAYMSQTGPYNPSYAATNSQFSNYQQNLDWSLLSNNSNGLTVGN